MLENKKFNELFETFKPNIGIIDVPYNPEPENKVVDDRKSAKVLPIEEVKEAVTNPQLALGNTEPLLTDNEKLHMDAPVIGGNQNNRAAPNRKKCLLIIMALVLVMIIVVLAVFWNKIFG